MQGHKQCTGERIGDGNEQFELFAQQKGSHNARPMAFPCINPPPQPFCCAAPSSGLIRAQLPGLPPSRPGFGVLLLSFSPKTPSPVCRVLYSPPGPTLGASHPLHVAVQLRGWLGDPLQAPLRPFVPCLRVACPAGSQRGRPQGSSPARVSSRAPRPPARVLLRPARKLQADKGHRHDAMTRSATNPVISYFYQGKPSPERFTGVALAAQTRALSPATRMAAVAGVGGSILAGTGPAASLPRPSPRPQSHPQSPHPPRAPLALL